MNLTISGHHVDVTPAIREYVESKLERVTRHFDQIVDISVIFCVDNARDKEARQRAEINLRVAGKTVNAECIDQNLYAAIDMVIDKLDRQVIKHKSKVQDHTNVAVKHMTDASESEAAAG
jgi:putative sigma-54 modulation protein